MKLFQGMTCPVCEIGILEIHQEDLEFEYKGEKTIISGSNVFKCQECEESFLDPKEERKIEKLLTDERRRIDKLLTSDEIRTIRKRFSMTQVEFAQVLRVGEKTFARYENGQATQGYAMDNLLRVLYEYPQALHILLDIPKKQNIPIVDANVVMFPYFSSDEHLSSKDELDELENFVFLNSSRRMPQIPLSAVSGG